MVSDDVAVEGKPLPAGTYGLHMIPGHDVLIGFEARRVDGNVFRGQCRFHWSKICHGKFHFHFQHWVSPFFGQ